MTGDFEVDTVTIKSDYNPLKGWKAEITTVYRDYMGHYLGEGTDFHKSMRVVLKPVGLLRRSRYRDYTPTGHVWRVVSSCRHRMLKVKLDLDDGVDIPGADCAVMMGDGSDGCRNLILWRSRLWYPVRPGRGLFGLYYH